MKIDLLQKVAKCGYAPLKKVIEAVKKGFFFNGRATKAFYPPPQALRSSELLRSEKKDIFSLMAGPSPPRLNGTLK